MPEAGKLNGEKNRLERKSTSLFMRNVEDKTLFKKFFIAFIKQLRSSEKSENYFALKALMLNRTLQTEEKITAKLKLNHTGQFEKVALSN